ncbi:MAG TPA: efflux RND transporter periplasmic adaptor subunit [Thermoanaerobaculia bacterium]|nr:efflux RND transporter periplasmic adaptor subunit [Thermoanaerobaculia bacterium]
MKSFFVSGLLLRVLLAGPPTPAVPAEGDVYSSNLMVDQDVIVSCQITGVIETIHVDRGSAVTKGQPLATLHMGEFDADVRQTKENMELARAQLDRAKALSASNIMSKADLDTSRAQYAVAVANWEKAKAIREYAVVRAPFTGVVAEKYARIGQKVVDVQTQPLFKITATEPLLARVYVKERDLLKIHRGDKVEVVPDSFPKARTTGSVQFISPSVDPASGTFQVVVQVRRDPSQPVLRPGIAVKVHFANSRRQ